MKEEIEKRQEFARELVELKNKPAAYAYVEEYGEEAIDKVQNIIESDLRSHVNSEGYGETVVYNFLENIDVLEKYNDSQYRPNVGSSELAIFREQLEEETGDEYGKHELIAYLQAYGGDLEDGVDDPTTEIFRDIDDNPTEQPYKDKFGSFSWALHVAGFGSNDEVTKGMLEEDLRRAVFRKNEGNDELVETLSAREIDESELLRSEANYRQRFGSIENAYEEAGLSEVRDIESDLDDWHKLVRHFPQVEDKEEREFTGIYPRTDFS